MKCKQCGNEYEAKRSDSRYCSVTCRVTAKRNKDVDVTDNPGVTANKESIRVTDNVTASGNPQPIDARAVDWASNASGESSVGPVDPEVDLYPRASDCGPHPTNRIYFANKGTGQVYHTMHEYQCSMSQSHNTINTGQYKPSHELAQHEVNRVSLPGDADYQGFAVC